MIRSLYSAATGMKAQQLFVDNISNNLANVNTMGFKKSKLEFEDLLYQTMEEPGENISDQNINPTGLQVGLGVKPAGTQKIFSQGSLVQTENKLDFAIQGDGFFQVTRPDGSTAYTRDGAFKLSDEGYIVTTSGYLLEPEIVLPVDADAEQFTIDTNGKIYMKMVNEDVLEEVGQLELARFINPAGLKSLGGNLYESTAASGEPVVNEPGLEGMGTLSQGYLEASNVQIVEEMVNMIMAQRAYEIASKGVTTSEEMLQVANQLKR
ncbi:MAG: flagellar basal body rod protein FlgG [Candidatus Raymondbacteria bacterium RifOxyA12_full_50_37]|uniref:Flagellar basal-body rod protein FlgG n=1 Tax=Candidatus Raymondbacteria bacterium RIFOXYD12_FULL_49_13 TaxID=1817890 RepID=A0A1F7F3A2_UNCRA|nr:MAG: flagellar basal body rod protein FlgG [Candidatus Raymondbacteria bacterium RIFOXYA2_FULL_49_16]OGJ91100.1 MAG: flagellar basal body rod protein FlgG [Candidatus Raymondbacteria bacterium RifOxyB12_full_50_8]OGJ91369.1 MAG: flagellar basal body rod protein FlgG [Candidatus Raymondbacteria bacterium RifOxyA12_full_50_37]OGJ97154.1 MAG: flagellar basal body rod protein FlgG [Candidatus Raymondbacteria bacterium RIFOXYC2_FULL_50_21]OGK01145.1 MAG: flagellar basal body rod protein FlgG [Can